MAASRVSDWVAIQERTKEDEDHERRDQEHRGEAGPAAVER